MSALDPTEVFVLVPDATGVSVVAVADLLSRLDEEPDMESAINNSAIDSEFMPNRYADLVLAVRNLNATGDADAYWSVR